ncbi:hypothetical protein MMC25_007043 [Agyrium rufum]|nr:hypothetical protein [Agyrium rufum]
MEHRERQNVEETLNQIYRDDTSDKTQAPMLLHYLANSPTIVEDLVQHSPCSSIKRRAKALRKLLKSFENSFVVDEVTSANEGNPIANLEDGDPTLEELDRLLKMSCKPPQIETERK